MGGQSLMAGPASSDDGVHGAGVVPMCVDVSPRGATATSGGVMALQVLRALVLGACLICVGALVPGSVENGSPAVAGAARRSPDSAAVTLSSGCWGGPGHVSLTVRAEAEDGSRQVNVSGRGLDKGSRWRVYIESEELSGPVRSRRANADGRWSLTITVEPDADGHLTYFYAFAHERNARHGCDLTLFLEAHIQGGTDCDARGRHGRSSRLDDLTATRSASPSICTGTRRARSSTSN